MLNDSRFSSTNKQVFGESKFGYILSGWSCVSELGAIANIGVFPQGRKFWWILKISKTNHKITKRLFGNNTSYTFKKDREHANSGNRFWRFNACRSTPETSLGPKIIKKRLINKEEKFLLVWLCPFLDAILLGKLHHASRCIGRLAPNEEFPQQSDQLASHWRWFDARFLSGQWWTIH